MESESIEFRAARTADRHALQRAILNPTRDILPVYIGSRDRLPLKRCHAKKVCEALIAVVEL
jgi:hypothetical protein